MFPELEVISLRAVEMHPGAADLAVSSLGYRVNLTKVRVKDEQGRSSSA